MFRIVQAPIPKEKYRSFARVLPICTVDVLFLSPGKKRTLLFFRKNDPAKGSWYTVGGRLRKNETIFKAAQRIARAETGFQIPLSKLHFGGVLDERFKESTTTAQRHNLNVFFYSIVRRSKVTLDSQHSAYQWFSVSSKVPHPFVRMKLAMVQRI